MQDVRIQLQRSSQFARSGNWYVVACVFSRLVHKRLITPYNTTYDHRKSRREAGRVNEPEKGDIERARERERGEGDRGREREGGRERGERERERGGRTTFFFFFFFFFLD